MTIYHNETKDSIKKDCPKCGSDMEGYIDDGMCGSFNCPICKYEERFP